MASRLLAIDSDTVEDDAAGRRISFIGVVNGDRLKFTISYAALRKISGELPQTPALAIFDRYASRVQVLAAENIRKNGKLPINSIREDDL